MANYALETSIKIRVVDYYAANPFLEPDLEDIIDRLDNEFCDYLDGFLDLDHYPIMELAIEILEILEEIARLGS